MKISGPFYSSQIQDYDYIENLFKNRKSFKHLQMYNYLKATLQAILQEKNLMDYPLGFTIPFISRDLKCNTMDFRLFLFY